MKFKFIIPIVVIILSCSEEQPYHPESTALGSILRSSTFVVSCSKTDLLFDLYCFGHPVQLNPSDQISITATVNMIYLEMTLEISEEVTVGDLTDAIESMIREEEPTARVVFDDEGIFSLYAGESKINIECINTMGWHAFNDVFFSNIPLNPGDTMQISNPINVPAKETSQLKNLMCVWGLRNSLGINSDIEVCGQVAGEAIECQLVRYEDDTTLFEILLAISEVFSISKSSVTINKDGKIYVEGNPGAQNQIAEIEVLRSGVAIPCMGFSLLQNARD